jgi:hypothetical protein
MAVIGRDFVCSREGLRAAKHSLRKDRVLPPRPYTRERCKAMISFANLYKSTITSSWLIVNFLANCQLKAYSVRWVRDITCNLQSCFYK